MRNVKKKNLCAAFCCLAAFMLWTLGVCSIDVQPIGPRSSPVGFAAVNRFVHSLTGVHPVLYRITDWLGLVPILIAVGFAVCGLIQWIRKKSLLQVDRSILVLGGFYLAVMAVYLFFELVVVNYRPVLIDGCLEASYPSSTTMLVMCVLPTAVMQFNTHIKHRWWKRCTAAVISGFAVFMVAGRLISGVHWFSDIVGGVLLSAGLIKLYAAVSELK